MSPKIKVKLTKSLWEHMSGSSFAAGDDDKATVEIFRKMSDGTPLSYEEAIIAHEGVDSNVYSLEAIKGSGSFEEERDVNAALRSARTLRKKLDAYIEKYR